MMNFSLSEEQIALQKSIVEFAKEHLGRSLTERDLKGEFDLEGWMACASFGIQGILVPKKYGGRFENPDVLTAVIALEALGYACKDAGLCFSLSSQIWPVQTAIEEFGSEEQKKRFLPEMCQGKLIACHAVTEPESGSDAYNLSTTAQKVEGGYILNGKKHLITSAPVSNRALVFAVTNDAYKEWGISAFFVDASSPGYSCVMKHKMGLRTVPIGEIEFNDCFVPDEDRIGGEGAGMSIINFSFEYDRSFILAANLGMLKRQLEENISYAKKRLYKGKPIGKLHPVQSRIADIKMKHDLAQLLLYKIAWLKENKLPGVMEASMFKLFLSESLVESGLSTLRNFGGIGYLTEYEVERDYRDVAGTVIYAGTSDIQRMVIANLLGL